MKGSLALRYTLFIHTLLLPSLYAATSIPDSGVQSTSGLRAHSRHASWRFQSHTTKFSVSRSTNEVTSELALTTMTTSSAPSIISPTTSTTTSTTPAQQHTDTIAAKDIETIHEHRLRTIVGSLSVANISSWRSTLGANGKWPDTEVDYTTGCPARRANWPAQDHWQRLIIMAGAWHGGLKGAGQFVKDDDLRAAISLAIDFWFVNDFTNPSCLDSGGTSSCPCSSPGFWNTNWFSNIILIPELVGETCLLLNDTLTQSQLANCTHITGRAYGTFDRNINGVGFLTGANTLDVAKVGIDQGLLTRNTPLVTDAYQRVHKELVIEDAVKADGIRPDGSFGQHGGIIYNGNYGKDYANDILDLEMAAGGTQFAANTESQNTFATLFDGDRWMIYRNALTGVLHWDFSVLGRFISFPVVDNQATGSIKINLTEVRVLGQQWTSSSLVDFADSLSENTSNANAGKLQGNRLFFDNDYMVHRGGRYVSTLKMFSSRTKNTECTNLQNPLGFHLADGVSYTYLRGDEYEDISAAWDWNLIPGITVDYDATPLNCDHTQFTGVEAFVGGASDGNIGISAMRYTNPFTKSLRWQKAWFFLDDDVQHVMIANIASASDAHIYSVLDQRRHAGPILVDGVESQTSSHTGPRSLWHGDIGYTFSDSVDAFDLSLRVGEQTGNWSTIGTSAQPPVTVDLFAAWIEHKSPHVPVSYTVFPGTDVDTFLGKSERLRLQSVQNDAHVSAVFDETHNTAIVVFWNSVGGSLRFVPSPRDAPITITANGNIAIIYCVYSGNVTVSDPSQELKTVQVTLSLEQGRKPPQWGNGLSKDLVFVLPTGGLAGSSISQNIQ